MSAFEELKAKVRAIEGGGLAFGHEVASLGGPLDRALPWRGLPYRALHEVAGPSASSCVAAIAARALARGGVLLWSTSRPMGRRLGEIYGPGLARFGIDPGRLWVVRPGEERASLWVLEEALRTTGVACAVAELDRLDLKTGRRLQLAAETGGGMGLVLRPDRGDRPTSDRETRPGLAVAEPSAALTRWRAAPGQHGGWSLHLWRVRGGAPWASEVTWDEQALSFAVVPALAGRAAPPHRPAASRATG